MIVEFDKFPWKVERNSNCFYMLNVEEMVSIVLNTGEHRWK